MLHISIRLFSVIFLALIVAAVIPQEVTAQHCPYDMASIIILDIRADVDGPIIPGLRITMIDSAGDPVLGHPDTVRFWQNPERTTHTGYIDNENPMQAEKIRFWFADDRYVLLPSYSSQPPPFSVLIEDIDGTANGGDFGKDIVKLRDNDWHPLCTSYTHWTTAEHDDQKVLVFFTPIRVQLTGGRAKRLQ